MSMSIRIRRTRQAIAGLALTGLAFVALATLSPGAAAAAPDSTAAYKEKCNSCHGPDGSGATPIGKSLKAGDLRAPAIQDKTDAQLSESIAKGKGKMPAFKALSAEEIAGLVAYVRSLAKPKA